LSWNCDRSIIWLIGFSPISISTPKPPERLPILALFTANTVSMVGKLLAMVAIPWFALETTGSGRTAQTAGYSTCVYAWGGTGFSPGIGSDLIHTNSRCLDRFRFAWQSVEVFFTRLLPNRKKLKVTG
jgi:hypothetical protein